MRAAVKTVLDNSKLFDASGALLPADQLAKQAGARQAAMAEIARTALSSKDLTAMSALGVADFVSRFSAELQREPFRIQFTVESEIARIQQQLRDAFSQFQVSFGVENVRALEAVTGRQFQTPDEVARGLTEAKAKAAEFRAAIDAAITPQGDKLRSEIDKILADVAARTPKRATFSGDYSEGLRGQFAAAMAEFERVRNLSKITQADLESVFNKFKTLRETSQQNLVGRLGFSDDLVRMQEAFAKLQALQGLQGKGVDPAAVQQLQSLERVIQGMQPALSNIGPGVSAGVQPSASIAGNLWSAAEATAVIQSNLSGVPTGAALGRAAGGPTGTDTIPAMLSPDEFVVRASSARKFASQLVAMNAGVRPIFRSEGGPTTNIGDISFGDLHIGGGKGADATARQLMSAIKRELRRGSGTL